MREALCVRSDISESGLFENRIVKREAVAVFFSEEALFAPDLSRAIYRKEARGISSVIRQSPRGAFPYVRILALHLRVPFPVRTLSHQADIADRVPF